MAESANFYQHQPIQAEVLMEWAELQPTLKNFSIYVISSANMCESLHALNFSSSKQPLNLRKDMFSINADAKCLLQNNGPDTIEKVWLAQFLSLFSEKYIIIPFSAHEMHKKFPLEIGHWQVGCQQAASHATGQPASAVSRRRGTAVGGDGMACPFSFDC